MTVPQSPNGGTCADQANAIILSIRRLTEELSQFSSFEPNPSLDKILSSISQLCHQTDVSPAVEDQVSPLFSGSGDKHDGLIRLQILNDPRITSILPKLRDLWAKAAGELEDSWASSILSAGTPKKGIQDPQTSITSENFSNNGTLAKELLASYPRLQNYKATIPVELGVISIAIGSFPSSIAMLGSGPLPLTSLSIMDFAAEKGHGMRILNIDVVPERIRSSEKIFSLLGQKYSGVSHQVADAAGDDLSDLSNYDAVYVASLIGNSDEDKIGVLRNTAKRMRKGAVLVVRSSSGLSRLLWPVSCSNQATQISFG